MTLKKRMAEIAKMKNPTLDDIGFVGVQQKMTPAGEKRMHKKTGEIIRARLASEKASIAKSRKLT